MNYKYYCSFCNQLLPTLSIDSFKECKNHPVIVQFYNSTVILQNNEYSITLSPNLTELYSKKSEDFLPKNPAGLIISIPVTIPVTPESFDSTIQKLLRLKVFS